MKLKLWQKKLFGGSKIQAAGGQRKPVPTLFESAATIQERQKQIIAANIDAYGTGRPQQEVI